MNRHGLKNLPRLAVLVLPLAIALAGCAPQTAEVSGKIYFKDKPLPSGKVSFFADGKEYRSTIHQDGKYTIPKLPPGPVKIAVVTGIRGPMPGPLPKELKKHPGEQPPGKGAVAEREVVTIPSRYHSIESSGLIFDVAVGRNEHNIYLTP